MSDLFCTPEKAEPQRSMLHASLNVLFPKDPQNNTMYSSYMHAMIALFPIPCALRRLEMVSELGLKASTLNEFVTVRLVVLVSVPLLEKDVLDVMIPLIIGTLNPDPFCLVYCWDDHGSSHFAANTHYDESRKCFPRGKMVERMLEAIPTAACWWRFFVPAAFSRCLRESFAASLPRVYHRIATQLACECHCPSHPQTQKKARMRYYQARLWETLFLLVLREARLGAGAFASTQLGCCLALAPGLRRLIVAASASF